MANSEMPVRAGARWRGVIFATMTFAYLLSQFLRHANAAIAEDVSADLALNAAQLGLMASLYYVAFAVAQVPIGVALDRFRPRFVMAGVMVLSAGGCLIFASAGSFAVLASGRFLIGLGMAAVLMGSLKILGGWYPGEKFGTVSGLLVGLGALGGLAAASPLVWFAQQYGWRAVFVLSGALVLLSAASVALLGREAATGATPTKPLARSDNGSIRAVFTDRRFWHLAPLNFFLMGVHMAFQSLWAGPFLHDVHAMNATRTGLFLSILSVGGIAGYVLCGLISDRLGAHKSLTAAGAAFVLCQVAFLIATRWLVPWLLAGVYFIFGFTGAFQLVTVVQAKYLFPASMSGRAMTAMNLFGFAGSALIQWVMGVIIEAFDRTAAGDYPPTAYASALAITAAATAAAVWWYWASPQLRNKLKGTGETGI